MPGELPSWPTASTPTVAGDHEQDCYQQGLKITLSSLGLGLGYGVIKAQWDPAFLRNIGFIRYVTAYAGRFGLVGASYGFSRCLYNAAFFHGHDNWRSGVLAGATAGASAGVFLRPSPNFASVTAFAAIGTGLLLAYEASFHTLSGPLARLTPEQQRQFRRAMWKSPPPLVAQDTGRES